ncbi:hypothetical protein Tco_1408314 [Tanacetum coccineum]
MGREVKTVKQSPNPIVNGRVDGTPREVRDSRGNVEDQFEKRYPPLITQDHTVVKVLRLWILEDKAYESIQEDSVELDENTFITPFNPPVIEEAKSSSTKIRIHQICMSSINLPLNAYLDESSSARTSDW